MPKPIPYPCPFCGGAVRVEATLDGLLFTCKSARKCGASVRFESDHFAEHPEDAMEAFARSYSNGGKQS